MEASFVDLRKRSGEIIGALRRNESITVLYRGRPAAVMHPIAEGSSSRAVADHPSFGQWADRDDLADPAEYVRQLRRGRFHAD